MIHSGLCSLTLKSLPPEEVIRHCAEAGLTHIEWWGMGHVPMGDVATGERIGRLTRDAGLNISTYGSYYRVGERAGQDVTFEDVLRTAVALKAPAIRVWAGARGSADSDDEYRKRVVADALTIADQSAGEGLNLVFEYHGGTLTDTNASAADFSAAVRHPSVFMGWQTRIGVSDEEKMDSLHAMLPRLGTLHVFNWTIDEKGNHVRRPLGEATKEWRGYFDAVAQTGRDHAALLEFVKGNSVSQFREDARVLRELLCR